MIVERYLDWASTAPQHLRAEAAGALARSYLHGDLEADIRAEIAVVLTRTLDDPSLAVRCAVAEAVSTSPDAPHGVVLALAQDAADVAEPVLSRSPLLCDHDLVDITAIGGRRAQIAIAGRIAVSAPVAAAIAEVGCAEACEALIRNEGARLNTATAARIARRHGDDGPVRDALVARGDLCPEIRQILMRSVADALSTFVTGCGWLGADRARRATGEACDRGAIAIAADASDMQGFVLHLARRDEFSPSLALRALLSGEIALFEAALAALSGQSSRRVAGFVRDFEGRGFALLYREAGFPPAALPAFRAALAAVRETGFVDTGPGQASLSLRMVERALTALERAPIEVAPIRALLRRFAAEAAREEARRGCAEIEARIAGRSSAEAGLDLGLLEAELADVARLPAPVGHEADFRQDVDPDLDALRAEIPEPHAARAA